MKTFTSWARLLVLSAVCMWLGGYAFASTARAAEDRGGEGDWPFFCSIADSSSPYEAFRLVKDESFDSGYAVFLYRNNRPEVSFEATVWDSDDHSFVNVLGADPIGVFRDRRVFAQISKDRTIQSMSSYDTVWRGTNPEFEMYTSTCQH